MAFETAHIKPKAILVNLSIGREDDPDLATEFEQLVLAAGAEPMDIIQCRRKSVDPRLLIGSGKTEEVRQAVMRHEANMVIFSQAVSPGQGRNLEKIVCCRVLDYTDIILDIFAQRARTYEGKLQVELAQLKRLSTRLIRGWTHLERQKGGIGLRGPGETQLETDRRLIGIRIKRINARLDKVVRQRQQNRMQRRRVPWPTVALVGYTNAGKSSLFNRLCEAESLVADQLFATLDPTTRRIETGSGRKIILSDTVGFIRDLPPELVAAFRATLEEVRSADLLLHVVDVSSHQRHQQIEQVNQLLTDIGAGAIPQLIVMNKSDLCEHSELELHSQSAQSGNKIWVSAATGEGLDRLLDRIENWFAQDFIYTGVDLSPTEGKLRATLYELNAVVDESVTDEGGWHLSVRLSDADYQRLFG